MQGVTDKKTILLVEDEAVIAMNESAMLQKHGFQVVSAYNAEEAIEAVHQQSIALILMDIDLGKDRMDGTEAAERILSEYELPIVFLTSHTEKEMVNRVKGITRYGYVLKNSGEFVLIESITMAFELFQAYQALNTKHMELERVNDRLVQSDKSLSRSERQYRLLFENLTSAFALHEMIYDDSSPVGYSFITVNPAFEKLTGLKASEIIGRNIMEILPDTEPYWIETYARVVETGESISFENYAQEFDKYYEVIAFRPDKNQFAVIFNDITKMRQYSQKISESEERFSQIFHNSGVMIMICEAEDNRLVDVNESFLTQTGFSREEIIGTSLVDLGIITKSDHIKIKDLIADGKAQNVELEMKHKNGAKFWALYNGQIIHNSQGKQLLSIAYDITQCKKAEINVKETKDFYELILETVHDGIWVTDSRDIIIYVNGAMAEIAGVGKSALENRNVLKDFPDETNGIFKTFYDKAKASLQPESYKALVITPAGRKTVQKGWLFPLVKNGIFDGMVTTILDGTERKAFEINLQ